MDRESFPSGDSKQKRNQEILYEEVQRQIDYQIETNRWLENQAGRLLRILIALIGILLSLAGRFVLTILNSKTQFSLVNVNRTAMRLVEHYGFIGVAEATLVVAVLAMSAAGFFFTTLSQLFVETPRYAMKIVWSPQVAAGINIGDDTGKIREEYYFNDLEAGLVDQYASKIEENQTILEESRSNWEECHQSIKSGISSFLLLLGAIIPLITFTDPILVIANFLLIMAYIGYQIISRISWSDIDSYVIRNKYTDASIVLLSVFYFLSVPLHSKETTPLQAIVLGIMFVPGVILLAFVPFKETRETTFRLLVRTGIPSLIILSILVILSTKSTGSLLELAHSNLIGHILYSIAGSTLIVSLSLIILLLLSNLYYLGAFLFASLPVETD